ncbi:hypothetical protein FPOA_01878 [Fusarium poae]|uniref:Uncharacterized protein n=1 Tax=Fusarium poae TaxID=36050 RepID=A0A1B8B5D4_FUSPO|nr:hypothetical protein FPOA_01878 [Fusarium poae]
MSISSVTGLGLYNYATLSNTASYAGSYSSGHSRDPSYSRRPSVPMNSYPASMYSRARNSTDSRVDPYSYTRTSESSHATKAASVNDEAIRNLLRKHIDRKDSAELSYSSSERPRYHRHSHQAYHSHHPDSRDNRYNSASAKSRRRLRHVASPPDLTLAPPPARSNVMAVKSTKKSNNMASLTWRRISQGIKMGKSKKSEQQTDQSDTTDAKSRRKSKWMFWAKQEPGYTVEANAAPPSPPKPRDEVVSNVNTKRRPSITDWLNEDSNPPQSPTTLKRLFEEE